MAVEGKLNYNDFVNKLNNSGIQTTYLSSGETNFEEYGTALSGELKQEIMDSFDNEQDYKLQEQIASLYKNKSCIQSQDFINSCKSMGLQVSVEYRNTTYKMDAKFDGRNHEVKNGAIAVYTVSDGQGGEIKIADANGNGALESEEIFMNQILGDIAHDIGNIADSSGVSANQSVNGTQNEQNVQASTETKKEEQDIKEEQEEVSQDDYNKQVEKYLKRGQTKMMAELNASNDLGVYNLIYTGLENEKNNKTLSKV